MYLNQFTFLKKETTTKFINVYWMYQAFIRLQKKKETYLKSQIQQSIGTLP